MRIGGDVGNRAYAGRRNLRALHRGKDLFASASAGPRLDLRVEPRLPGSAPVVVSECRIGGKIFTPHGLREPLEDRIAVGRDQHVASIAASIGRSGRDAG